MSEEAERMDNRGGSSGEVRGDSEVPSLGGRHREPTRFWRRRSRFQVAVGQGEERMSHFPFGPVADCFSFWACSSHSVEQAES